ncbi:GDSL family lipase [Mucilaginibacter sp. Bleaf8]|uniref:GDSL-type esterase/lipase family protein n=1 Tax=Mucilaginibacter sp. Bleaf8 TaxID=2834430 RepID=UPI001BD0E436|nr:GDSL-type esterase/lipase family protein [Mucilaginibacter sp. Bleaf8]MBS7564145.1 GDSL family lipase [Mucilaginibacter sp. Bleaf8]
MYWYEDEVKRLEQDYKRIPYIPETLFFGSSTIRLWQTLYQDFAHLKPINLGFGGSTLAGCVWFFERIMEPYNPKRIIVYAGDNDLGDGRHPEEVFIFFQQLMTKTEKRFGNLPCYYISLKPSISRWHMADKFMYTNNLIENEIVKQSSNWRFINIFKRMLDASGQPERRYFGEDGLHLSNDGYDVWREVVKNSITL